MVDESSSANVKFANDYVINVSINVDNCIQPFIIMCALVKNELKSATDEKYTTCVSFCVLCLRSGCDYLTVRHKSLHSINMIKYLVELKYISIILCGIYDKLWIDYI